MRSARWTLLGTALGLIATGVVYYFLPQSGEVTITWSNQQEQGAGELAGNRLYFYPGPAVVDVPGPVEEWTGSIQGYRIVRLTAYDIYGLESEPSLGVALPPSRALALQVSADLATWSTSDAIVVHGHEGEYGLSIERRPLPLGEGAVIRIGAYREGGVYGEMEFLQPPAGSQYYRLAIPEGGE